VSPRVMKGLLLVQPFWGLLHVSTARQDHTRSPIKEWEFTSKTLSRANLTESNLRIIHPIGSRCCRGVTRGWSDWVHHRKRQWGGENVDRGPKRAQGGDGAALQTSLTIGQEFIRFIPISSLYSVSIHLLFFQRHR